LPPEHRGTASTRIAEAAADLGMDWIPQDKFVDPGRSPRYDCRATCMLGCRCQAKWNAAEYIDEAVANGLDLWTGARVDQVLHNGRHVYGVRGRRNGRAFTIEADVVVLAAGGIGSPVILQHSGLAGAGDGMTLDITTIVYGRAPFPGNGNEPPMTWSFADDELGAMFSTLVDPWLNYPLAMLPKGPAPALSWTRWDNSLGVMIKLKDEISGSINQRGQIDKGLTDNDRARQSRAEAVARAILVQAGCDPESILMRPQLGTHPSGTVRIDTLLSRQLETKIDNLYVCDASVFPEALARPTVLTIMSLARRLADHLLEKHGISKIVKSTVNKKKRWWAP
jgi:choline dehydrogenase-like flavoprotein